MAKEKVGRNDPCPCGSGKKFKQCCQDKPAHQPAPHSSSEQPIAQLMQLGLQHHQVGSINQAEEIYRRVLEASPSHPDALHYLGLIAQQKADPATAIELIEKALVAKPNDPFVHLSLGNVLLDLHRYDEALACYVQASKLKPDYVEAIYNQGNVLLELGRYHEADQAFGQAIAIKADFQQAHLNRSEAFLKLGQYADALQSAKTALQLAPQDALAHNNIGTAMNALHRYDEAIASYGKALQINPKYMTAYINLGNVFREIEQFEQAETCYRKALEIRSNEAEAYFGLGMIQQQLAQFDEALQSYKKAIAISANYAEAHNNLGVVFKAQGKCDDALACFSCAIDSRPAYAEAHSNLGLTLHVLGKSEAAFHQLHRALEIDPNCADAHCNLGLFLQKQGKLTAAIQKYRKAIELNSKSAEAHNNLGFALQSSGRLEEAIACYRAALRLRPNWEEVHSSLIFAFDMSPATNTALQQVERKRWNQKHALPLRRPDVQHSNHPDSERQLRIGYVSGDLREHSAARVFGAMLVNYDLTRFEVFAYSNSVVEDEYSRLFQSKVTAWRNIAGLSDDAAADLIRRDAIDVLVDLSGHTMGSRLLVFARKPAPVQITAWGYALGTGMNAMDAFFADPVMVPPAEISLFVEQVRYLPSGVSYFEFRKHPDIQDLPALSANMVTFGSFNRLIKLSAETTALWIKILSRLPNSRLILKAPELEDPDTKTRLEALFSSAGIDLQRLTLLGNSSWEEHLNAFNQVDIALDPFPHGGGVTTMEGLMMGVPVVTLRWPTVPGRLSASILGTLGLEEWIAETPQQYVEIALKNAQNLPSLAALRMRLRQMLTASVIGDNVSYVARVEEEYRRLWLEWCDRQRISAAPAQVP